MAEGENGNDELAKDSFYSSKEKINVDLSISKIVIPESLLMSDLSLNDRTIASVYTYLFRHYIHHLLFHTFILKFRWRRASTLMQKTVQALRNGHIHLRKNRMPAMKASTSPLASMKTTVNWENPN